MKKTNILIFVMLFFSIMAEAVFSTITVHAESKEIQLIDEKWLKLSYKYEKFKESNQWVLNFKRQSEEEQQQRLKFKITDEQDQTIDYPEMDNMVEKDGWLIEKEFSDQKEGQLAVELSQSIKKLNVYVQMDQQQVSTINEEKGSKVQENILEREKPFILEVNKKPTKQAAKASSEKSAPKKESSEKVKIKEEAKEVTVSSEKFVGPKKEGQKAAVAQMKAAGDEEGLIHAPLYENKETTYKHDAGTYPENSWQPVGQTNVINHQGGVSGQAGWDGVQSWNVANDDYSQSYIKYGDDAAKPNIALRKYVQQTNKPDEFKVKLNVRGSTIYKPGVDIVFLLDNTGSMTSDNKKTNSLAAVRKIVTELKKVADAEAKDRDEDDPPSNSIRVGAHIFASYDKTIETVKDGWIRSNTHHKLSNNPDDWGNIATAYGNIIAGGPTFTQRGLQEAADIFDDSEAIPGEEQRHKLLFILTDGAPNMSWEPVTAVSEPSMYFDQTLITSFKTGTKPNYLPGLNLGAEGVKTKFKTAQSIEGKKLSSHLTTTNSTAYALKKSGIEIHSIAVLITGNAAEGDHNSTELHRGLFKTATKKANAIGDNEQDYFYYHARYPEQLTENFKDWYQTIIRTVDKGVITDPLGDMVDLINVEGGEHPKWRQVNNGAPAIENDYKPEIKEENNDRLIKVNNLNLTSNQEIEVEYTVRLRITDNSFVSNKWYPTNGETFLEPLSERTDDKLEFGRPSVKFQKEDYVIPVEKVWSDQQPNQAADFWGLRKEVTVKLQKWNGSAWQDVESKPLNAGNNWKNNFSAVEGGENKKYRVLEVTRTPGYKQPKLNYQTEFTSANMPTGGIKITNELLKGDYSFEKFMEDGTTKFEGTDLPKFKVTRGGKLIAENLMPNTSTGKVTIAGLPIGDYIVEETYVPKGFDKMPNFTINVTENNSSNPTALVFKVNNSTEEYRATNKLKDFSVKVEKVDGKGEPLDGATFKLMGPGDYVEIISKGSVFHFTGLRPGRYTLTETDNPNLYEKLKDPIHFTIAQDGKVTVEPHPNVTGSGGTGESENTIQLKVTNKKVREGVLPRTGAFGIQGMFLAAGLLVIGGVLLSLVPPYLNRRKK